MSGTIEIAACFPLTVPYRLIASVNIVPEFNPNNENDWAKLITYGEAKTIVMHNTEIHDPVRGTSKIAFPEAQIPTLHALLKQEQQFKSDLETYETRVKTANQTFVDKLQNLILRICVARAAEDLAHQVHAFLHPLDPDFAAQREYFWLNNHAEFAYREAYFSLEGLAKKIPAESAAYKLMIGILLLFSCDKYFALLKVFSSGKKDAPETARAQESYKAAIKTPEFANILALLESLDLGGLQYDGTIVKKNPDPGVRSLVWSGSPLSSPHGSAGTESPNSSYGADAATAGQAPAAAGFGSPNARLKKTQ